MNMFQITQLQVSNILIDEVSVTSTLVIIIRHIAEVYCSISIHILIFSEIPRISF